MKKGVKVLLIILIILIVLGIAGYIVYNYVSVKSLNFCISKTQVEATVHECDADQECYDYLTNEVFQEISMPDVPDFVEEHLDYLWTEIAYCEGQDYCFYKKIRGFGEDLGKIKSCNSEEYMYSINLTPKQLVEILKYITKQ